MWLAADPVAAVAQGTHKSSLLPPPPQSSALSIYPYRCVALTRPHGKASLCGAERLGDWPGSLCKELGQHSASVRQPRL